MGGGGGGGREERGGGRIKTSLHPPTGWKEACTAAAVVVAESSVHVLFSMTPSVDLGAVAVDHVDWPCWTEDDTMVSAGCVC